MSVRDIKNLNQNPVTAVSSKKREHMTSEKDPNYQLDQAANLPQTGETLSPADAHFLQRTIGNRALGSLIVQAKLTLGPVNDQYEQEADSVAKEVVGQLNTPAQATAQRQDEEEMAQMKPLQRQEEEEMMQTKPVDSIQRVEDEDVMTKSSPSAEGGSVSSDLEGAIQSARGSGDTLSENVRGSMETGFGADFSGVKVHTDSESDQLNQSLQARAFTTGQDIFFRSGEYSPGSSGGQELLAHELTHVVQQNGPGVQKEQEDGKV